MRPTGARDLVPAGLLAAVVVYLLVRVDYGSLPPLPRLAGVTLLVLGLVELGLGFSLRSRIRARSASRPVQPLAAARALALAKASSLGGSVMLGAWLGLLAYVVPAGSSGNTAADGDTTSGAIGAASAAVLVACALWLEYCCRTPNDESDRPEGSRRSRGGRE